MNNVAYSRDARADLVEIGGYIASDSEHRAETFVSELQDMVLRIARTPRIYKSRHDLQPGLRSARLGKYLILFRIVPGGIEVVRVVYGARDLKSLFEN